MAPEDSGSCTVRLDPPVKSIPGLSPGAKIKKTMPGKITRKENKKNHALLSEKFKLSLLANNQFFVLSLISAVPVGMNRRTALEAGVAATTLIKVRLTVIAVNILTATPMAKVIAKPWTIVAPNWSENQ